MARTSRAALAAIENPLAAIHTVMKRLVRQQEAEAFAGPDGRTSYRLPRRASIAIAKDDLRDQAFLRQMLEAPTPAALAELVAARRATKPRS